MCDARPGPPWLIILALAASLSLSACFSKGVVQEPKTPAEQALIAIGNAYGAIMLAYDDVVAVRKSNAVTQDQANAKLDDLDRYRGNLNDAKILVETGGSISDAENKVAAARIFLKQLKTFIDSVKGG